MAVYFKINLRHPDHQACIDTLVAEFKLQVPKNVCSINKDADGTFAWLKLRDDFIITHPAIIDKAATAQAHQNKVEAEVTRQDWHKRPKE